MASQDAWRESFWKGGERRQQSPAHVEEVSSPSRPPLTALFPEETEPPPKERRFTEKAENLLDQNMKEQVRVSRVASLPPRQLKSQISFLTVMEIRISACNSRTLNTPSPCFGVMHRLGKCEPRAFEEGGGGCHGRKTAQPVDTEMD